MGRNRAILRLFPLRSNIRRGLRAVRRVLSALKPHMPKLLKIGVLTLGLVSLLTSSAAYWTFTTTPPAPSAKWVLPTFIHHYLGEPIEATLRITGLPGVYVNSNSLPREGETVGPFEVRKRTARIHNTGGIQTTEYMYALQYLLPLDEGVFTERELREVTFEYRYRYYYRRHRLSGWLKDRGTTWPTKIRLLRRTRPGDQPFPPVGKVAKPFAFSIVVKVVGGLVLSGVLFFQMGKLANTTRMRKKRRQLELAEAARPRLALISLWKEWLETGDYRLFLRACVIVRDLEKRDLDLPPGGLLPRLGLWLITTVALYSGRELSSSRIEKSFKLFLRRFPVQGSSMLFVPGS